MIQKTSWVGVRTAVVCFCLTAMGASPLFAVVFDGGNSTTDFNDPINWTEDTLPGGTIPPSTEPENAVIGSPLGLIPAVVDLNGPLTISPIGDLRIGDNILADGTFNHTSGDVVTADGKWSFIGVDGDGVDPAKGTYNLSGDATFTTQLEAFADSNHFHIGLGGGPRRTDRSTEPFEMAKANQGYLNVSGDARFQVNDFFVGSNDDNYGEVNQTGGGVFAENWLSIGRNGGARGVYNMSGGQLAVTQDGITVGENGDSTGELNLSGTADVDAGILRVGRGYNFAPDTDPDTAGTGLLSIEGANVDVTVANMHIGTDDGAIRLGEGTVKFTPLGGSVSALKVLENVTLNDGSVSGFAKLEIDTGLAPSGDVLLVDVGSGSVTGTFTGLSQGAIVPNTNNRTICYSCGDGNDIYLIDPNAGVIGDYNGNGQVEQGDLDLVLLNWGDPWPPVIPDWVNDQPTDGAIDQDDLDVVLLNWGSSSAIADAVRVPEPTTGFVLTLAAVIVLVCGRSAAGRSKGNRRMP